MERRNFIKIIAGGSCFALYPHIFSGCASSASSLYNKRLDGETLDDRLKLISTAMMAPNSHNTQPWLIRLQGEDAFDLFVDQTRLLPETDPPARQIHISQGTFLEFLKIAATGAGYDLDIHYFPEGAYSNQRVDDKPVAAVRLIKRQTLQPDPLLPWLEVRQSNKRVYTDEPIPETKLNDLQNQEVGNGFTTFYSSSDYLLRSLAPLLGKAMAIEGSDSCRNKETAKYFRFSKEESRQKRDGFDLGNNGVTGLARFFAEGFFLGSREDAYAPDSAFVAEGIKLTYNQVGSAKAYGWIISNSNSRLNQVKCGELYSRVNLYTAKLGIAQHPLSQILQEYEDMREQQQKFLTLLDVPEGNTVQMIYRLGYAKPVPHTRRRLVPEILI